jgi:hypothetical protein
MVYFWFALVSFLVLRELKLILYGRLMFEKN